MTPNISEVKVSYNPKYKQSELRLIRSVQDIIPALRDIWTDDIMYRETFVLLCLNRTNKLIGWTAISKGTDVGCVVGVKEIAQVLINTHACSYIIAHNHPSGATAPSESDRFLTKKVQEAMNLFDIKLLDHIILTAESYYSFADNGLIDHFS